MKVIAIDRGHDGLQVREVGDVFDMPDDCMTPEDQKLTVMTPAGEVEKIVKGQPPTWFKPYKEPKKGQSDLV